MAFRESFEKFAKTAYDKTGEAVEYTKLNARILSEKTAIKDDYKKLGEYIYQAYKSGTAMDDKALEFCRSIDSHNQAIEKIKDELNGSSKTDQKASSSSSSDSAPETVIVSKVVNTTKDEVEMAAEENSL